MNTTGPMPPIPDPTEPPPIPDPIPASALSGRTEPVAPADAAVPEALTAARRRPPPPSRLSPAVLAEARRRGGAQEGLSWLGREPEAKASLLYRAVRLLARFILFALFRFRVATSGQELLPRGGYLLIAAAHRGWMDPFAVIHALPVEPRAWFLGSGPSTFTARWREVLIHRLGGLLPVWRGGVGVDQHVASARAVLANGGVFVQMPEGTVSGSPGRIGPFRNGAALIALRTGAPIVPLAIAGTEELYLGRRMATRVLPLTSARELLGEAWDGMLPEAGSREELELARRLTARLGGLLGPVVEELQPGTVDPQDHPRRLRRRLTWLFLRPGRLDRDEGD
ncbi:MAG: lysophospholipid acyltransferase family protein [Candidatus Limnocylindrales bacterium]